MALPKQPHRHRSSSDPFSDPPSISYSSYGVPTLSRNAPPQPTKSRAPPVPPKIPSQQKPNMSSEITTVPREQVTRTRMGRSQTQLPPANPTRPAAPANTRRSASQDSVPRVANTAEKAKSGSRRTPKKGSSHADVIDRLDFSGVGPMFHHDGPFDACAPSRNRHRTKAPMLAWAGAAEEDREALANAREIPSSMSPYPSPGVYTPYEAPKKKHDAIAEAWGIHEPEPFEDFSAGGGYSGGQTSEFNTPSGRNGTYSRRNKEGREARDRYKEYLEDSQGQVRRQPTKRTPIPPPQPIFVPEGENDVSGNGAPSSPTAAAPSSPGAPKRTKSLMHRIRKMREAPNVPATYEEQNDGERDPSPPSSFENSGSSQAPRPTHRAQNSFLGKFGGAPRGHREPPSPSDEAYVYVEEPAAGRREKSLPRPPGPGSPNDGPDGYFDGGYASAGGGLGRKTSLLKKIRGVGKGGGTPGK